MFEVATPLAALFAAMGPRVFTPAPPLVDWPSLVAQADAEGEARGRLDAAAELLPLRHALTNAIQAFEAAAVIDAMSLQPLFVALVGQVAAAVVEVELRQSPASLERLVAAALTAIEIDGTASLRASVRDAALLEGIELGVPLIADPDLADGEIRVDGSQHIVAASLPARLAEIVAGL